MARRKKSIGFLVDKSLNIIQFIGRTAPFVELSPGNASLRLPVLLRPVLRNPVIKAMNDSRRLGGAVMRSGLTFSSSDRRWVADLTVEPSEEQPSGYWRVLFEIKQETTLASRTATTKDQPAVDRHPLLLEHYPGQERDYAEILLQLGEARDHQEILAEELTTTNEELRTANAELLATNQELIESQAVLEKNRNTLQEQFRFISTVLDTVGALVVVIDGAGTIVEFNRACEQASGVPAAEARGRSVLELIPPSERDAVVEATKPLYTGTPSVTHENDWVARSGELRRISWLNTTIRDSAGRVKYVISTGLDITERRRAERSLAASEAKFRAVIDTAAEAILAINTGGEIVMANPAAERLFGYSPEELLGKPIEILIPVRYQAAHTAKHAHFFSHPKVRRIGALELNIFGVRKDGSEVQLEIGLSHVESDEGNLAIAFVQDVTEIALYRQRLQSLARRLMKAQEDERRRIARELHDDLTQTISVLGMKLGFLKNSVDGPREKYLEDLDSARQQVDRLAEEIRDLSHGLHPSVLEFSGLLPAMEAFVADLRKLNKPKVELIVHDLPDALPSAHGAAIYRIAQESVRNAMKHSGASKIRIEMEANKSMLRMSIKDNGSGFNLADSHSSAGLGIISMEERALDLNGEFNIQSAPGKGTIVEIIVPISETNPEG